MKGIEEAERLQEEGYKPIQAGLFTVLLERECQPEPNIDWQAIEDNRLYEKGERP